MKKIIKYVLVLFIAILTGIGLLSVINYIPNQRIRENAYSSKIIFTEEKNRPKVPHAYHFYLDNFTDAIMINTAISVDTTKPIESAILMRRGYRLGDTQYLITGKYDSVPLLHIIETLDGYNRMYFEYSRYWHGYMLYLRPLLYFCEYRLIRSILSFVLVLLGLVLVITVFKKINTYSAIATLLMLIFANIWAIGYSLQFTSVFLVMLIASIIIVWRQRKIKNFGMFFFVVGIITSFMDLLTAPLLTLGIPLIYYLLISDEQEKNIKNLLKLTLLWFLGYGLMWGSKWIISDVLYHTNTISQAIHQGISHTVKADDFSVGFLLAIKENISFIWRYFLITVITFIVINGFTLITKIRIDKSYLYYIVAFYPIIWFIVLKTHSYAHCRFTYRSLLISLLAMLIPTFLKIKIIIHNFIVKKQKEVKGDA